MLSRFMYEVPADLGSWTVVAQDLPMIVRSRFSAVNQSCRAKSKSRGTTDEGEIAALQLPLVILFE
jgi:hypothetical protein